MTIEQQWQEDVKQFGELAYLMWEKKEDVNDDYYVFASNLHVFDAIGIVDENGFGSAFGSFHVRRKQSAALEFDLVAARAGDEVEVRDMTGWHNCICDFSTATIRKNLVSFDGKLYSAIAITNLRMKHPRRVGVDYSQFEVKS